MIECFYYDKEGAVKSVYNSDPSGQKNHIVWQAKKRDGHDIEIINVVVYGKHEFREDYVKKYFPFVDTERFIPTKKRRGALPPFQITRSEDVEDKNI